MTDGKGWTCLWEAKAILGESTIWDHRDGCVYWVDIDAPSVNWYHLASGEKGSWIPPQWISAIALREHGGFVASCREGLAYLDPKRGAFQLFSDPVPDHRIARLNDGVTDRKGRYWTGSCDSSQWDDSTTAEDKETSLKDFDKRSTGELYRIDGDGTIHTMERNIVTANGPAFSPDGRTAYVNDSMPLVTWVYDLAEDGTLSNRRDFLKFSPDDGYPDGMAVDVDGCIWMAFYESWMLRRFAPDASLVEERQLPIRRGLRPAFGGENLDRLFLITGSAGYTPEMWHREPLAGGLFELHAPGTRGLASIPFPG